MVEILSPIRSAQLLVALFLAILFLQSGIDKMVDRKGNLDWLKGHFANSPFKNIVPLLLTVITLTEVAAGVLSATGAIQIAFFDRTQVALYGAQLSGLNILMLFLGQRLAKDYVGAATLVSYFIAILFGIWLLS
ncbi:DoxX family protein [Flammeovirgaceae bacterium SG7u.111]|nr:DoxX family protein [Flammeovirgaceae bacterium SG7u.132]WPO35665.1 DoxX family protein [Flammeovirgaceae bacterium SG7u.111]